MSCGCFWIPEEKAGLEKTGRSCPQRLPGYSFGSETANKEVRKNEGEVDKQTVGWGTNVSEVSIKKGSSRWKNCRGFIFMRYRKRIFGRQECDRKSRRRRVEERSLELKQSS